MTVLDASALLAYLLDEAGADEVEQALGDQAAIGAVNLAEVLSKLSDAGEDPDSAWVASPSFLWTSSRSTRTWRSRAREFVRPPHRLGCRSAIVHAWPSVAGSAVAC